MLKEKRKGKKECFTIYKHNLVIYGEDPEVIGGVDGAGDRHEGVDLGGCGGAGVTED